MKDITVQPNITIRQAMKALNKTAEKCLLVVNDNKKLLGTLTDGDLRRRILAGANFSEDISDSYNSEPTVLVKEKFTTKDAKQLMRDRKLSLIPIVDENKLFLDYIIWELIK